MEMKNYKTYSGEAISRPDLILNLLKHSWLYHGYGAYVSRVPM